MKKDQSNQFHIVRAEKAGVFLCRIVSTDRDTYTVSSLRRLYYWSGALDVSTLAKEGVTNPRGCKFSAQLGEEDTSTIFDVIEVHPVSEKALQIINSIPAWEQ